MKYSKFGLKETNFGHRYDRESPFKLVKSRPNYTRNLSEDTIASIKQNHLDETRRSIIMELARNF